MSKSRWTESQMLSHKDIALECWSFFIKKGLSKEATASLLGNIECESHFNVNAKNPNSDARGLVQWLGGRMRNLGEYGWRVCHENGYESLDVQLKFIWAELNGSEKKSLRMLKAIKNVSSGAEAVCKLYERPNEKEANIPDRKYYAEFWYKQFSGEDMEYSYTGSDSSSNDSSNNNEPFFKYFDGKLLNITEELGVAMMDALINVDPLRKTPPIHKFDYIPYEHRDYSEFNLTIGDCTFTIPPTAISIVSQSSNQEIVTLRQENSQKIKNGCTKRNITLEIVFHGSKQINGYKVESPTGYYYVDGLRQLFAQFKCTPFLPIENELINGTYDIYTVALQSILCSTVEGFPDMIIANVTLQEVDLSAYIECSTMFFSDYIDWDLFRFYYQRQLTEKHEYGKLQSIPVDKTLNKFKISVLNQNIFNNNINYNTDYEESYDKDYNLIGTKNSFTFYDIVQDKKVVYADEEGKVCVEDPSEKHPSNYDVYVDSEDTDVHISTFQCGYSNMITNIQMAENTHPTSQYMGGMDTIFNITLETTNKDIVNMIEKCNINNDKLIKEHRDFTSLGFVKLESELVEFCGSKYVMIDNVTTSTVPDFPELYIVQISCISYDLYQKENEGIRGFSPFKGDKDNINGKGTKENAILQSPKGLREKVRQDTCVEEKLRATTELYPDLKLPTYSEVDEAIKLIKEFRDTHKNIEGKPLTKYPLDKYPRSPQQMLHGVNDNIENLQVDENGFVTNVPEVLEAACSYEGFVDPDFYMFYPDTYKELINSTKDEREELGIDYKPRTMEGETTNVTRTFYANSSTEIDIGDYDYNLYAQGATELQNQFIALARKKIGASYNNARRLGPYSYDCSGLVSKCLMEMGIIKTSFTTSGVANCIKSGLLVEKYKVSSTKNIKELLAHANPGDLLHVYNTERGTSMGHIAIYSGNGKMVHASSSKGVVEVDVIAEFIRVLAVPALMKGVASSVTQKTVKNKDLKESSSSTTITNKSTFNSITEEELNNVAKVIEKLQSGTKYVIQVAIAQLIYDRFTDSKCKYGNLNTILESSIFKGMATKIPKSSTSYKAAENVFCKGERVSENKLLHFLNIEAGNSNYVNLDKKYKRVDGKFGDFTFWTNEKKSKKKKFTLIADNSDNSKTTYGSSISEHIQINVAAEEVDNKFAKYFGKPIIVSTDKMDDDSGWIQSLIDGRGLGDAGNQEHRYKVAYNRPLQILMSSFVNACEYGCKGRLVRAFPTYLFCIVDEDGNWLDGRKLWANYYALRSIAEIQVASYNDYPVNTATITVTNSYGNLSSLPPNSFYYSISKDKEYGKFQRYLYSKFGMIPGFGPKLTQKLVDQKNIIYDSMIIRAGSRMHLRMGYGSDPLGLPVIMNGYITDLSLGDIIEFVCVSDGVELTNGIISDNPKDINGMFENQESSNICIDMLTARQHPFLNRINNKWGEPNKYGIEHFGLYYSQHVELDNFEITNKVYSLADSVLPDDVAGGVSDAVETVVNGATTTVEAFLTAKKLKFDGIFKSLKTIQYDIAKNIYRSSYDGSLALYTPFAGFADGEKNLCFNQYNKTPWDAMQMSVMNAPQYLGMPLYHQFESRFFFGLPWFLAKYRYDLINGKMYDEAKSFAQVHFLDSSCNIIDNQMCTTRRDIYTNSIVMYVLGKTPKASPTLYSDRSIPFSQQSTKIFDSTVTQNIIGPDQLYEWLTFSMGKDGACRVGTTQLLWNWEKAYQGDIFLIGDGGIFPCDYLFLDDRFNDINGLCIARTVLHSLSAKTGFVTTVTPGMIGISTDNHAQALTTMKNYINICTEFNYLSSLKKIIKNNVEYNSKWYNDCRTIANIATYTQYFYRGYKTIKFTRRTFKVLKSLKTLKYAEAMKELKTMKTVLSTTLEAAKATQELSKIGKIGKSIKTVFSVGKKSFTALGATTGSVGSIPGIAVGAIVGALIDILLTAVIDYFSYNNVVVLLPLSHKSNPYAPIVSGEKLLLTGSSNQSEEKISDSLNEDSYNVSDGDKTLEEIMAENGLTLEDSEENDIVEPENDTITDTENEIENTEDNKQNETDDKVLEE